MTFTKKELYICIIGLLACWISSFFIIQQFFPKISDSGAFGDTFGAINSLFSGFALFGIIVSIFMQREELKLQRQELEMTRNELAKSAEAQGEQVEIQVKLAKLNAYSSLLSQLNPDHIHYARNSVPYINGITEILNELSINPGKK